MANFPPVDEQLKQIRRGVEEIIPEQALRKKLERSRERDEPLTVKLGCDPSRPDLHLGHAVVLRKLRQFQDLGHQALLIVGDFTGMIGDPSGRSTTRPSLTLEETREHGRSYFEQASRILDADRVEIRHNSDWLGEMTFEDVIKLSAKYTVARMLERDDFEERYNTGKPIGVHEFLYPLAQGQDSVAIDADVELGGTDQKFNLLVGRHLQEAEEQEPQICLTMPILEGTDGTQKMSKSLDNYIGITEDPAQMYGKTLSIPDVLIYRYFELASGVPTSELPRLKEFAADDPRDAKHELAASLVRFYHGEQAEQSARRHFEQTIVQGDAPDDIEDFMPEASNPSNVGLLNLMSGSGLTNSNSDARRLIRQNAVSIDGEKVSDTSLYVDLTERAPFVLKVGKRRYVRVVWNATTR